MKWKQILLKLLGSLIKNKFKKVAINASLGPKRRSMVSIFTRDKHIVPANVFLNKTSKQWKGIVIHHSLTDDGNSKNWKAIIKWHIEHNGWSDVGYHFGIEKVNDQYKVFEGRGLHRRGAHTKENNYNGDYLGICIVGNYDKYLPPKEALKLAYDFVSLLRRKYGISLVNVIGHREAQALAGVGREERKSCPGKYFNMEEFRKGVSNA